MRPTSRALLLCAVSALLPPSGAFAQDAPDPVATVNGAPISLSDYRTALSGLLEQLQKTQPDSLHDPESRRQIEEQLLEELINQELLLQEAIRQNKSVGPREIDAGVAEIKQRFTADDSGRPLSPAEAEEGFQGELVKEGLTYPQFRNRIGKQLLMRAVIEEQVKSRLPRSSGEAGLTEGVQRYIASLKARASIVRSLAAAARDAASPPPAAGMSRAELEALVQRAAEKALKEQSPAPRPPRALSSDVDAPAYTEPEKPDDFALVVGVEKYKSLPEARFAERDAQAVREHLLALGVPPRNAQLLLGPDATLSGLQKYLETWLARVVKDKSRVFVYFSGHGAPDPETGLAYLVPWDGDPAFLGATAYPLKRLYDRLGSLKAGRVVVMLDSCFSGNGGRSVLPRGVRPLVSRIDMGGVSGGRILVLTASSANQISGSLEEQGHGLFTYFLLKGLNGAAATKEGRVTLRALHQYLVPKVSDEANRENRSQTPQLLPASTSPGAEAVLRGARR